MSSEFVTEVYGGIAAIDDAYKKLDKKKLDVPVESAETISQSNASNNTKVKLPKLEVRKFSGKIQERHEFWDSFESAIHKNTSLSNVDKFTNYNDGNNHSSLVQRVLFLLDEWIVRIVEKTTSTKIVQE